MYFVLYYLALSNPSLYVPILLVKLCPKEKPLIFWTTKTKDTLYLDTVFFKQLVFDGDDINPMYVQYKLIISLVYFTT